MSSLRRQLAAPAGAAARSGGGITYRISLPTLHGVRPFVLSETFVVPASDVAGHQRLRTFVGNVEGDNGAGQQVSLVLTPDELRADLQAGSGSTSLRRAAGGAGYVLRAERTEQTKMGPCGTVGNVSGALRPSDFETMPAPFSFGTQLRRLKYAILVTKEYYVTNGNTDAAVELAVVAAMNQMSGLFLRELSLSFELVKPTGGTRYYSAMTTATLLSSEPPAPGRLYESDLDGTGAIINARFGPSNFALGHCFHSEFAGTSYPGVICNAVYKANAWSVAGAATGFEGVLAHEMGHQLGSYHTFAGPCGANNERSRLEPGGGSTIMSYAFSCGEQSALDMTEAETQHFNLHSLNQMRNNLVWKNDCQTLTANANRPPTLNAGPDYTIPRNTPFTLTASGADPDGDALAYTWNQFDYSPTNIGALGSIPGAGGTAAVDDPNSPLFRARAPHPTPSRTFPDLRYVLADANRPNDRVGEALPNVGRDIHFVVTARDQRPAGGTFTTDNVTLTVAPNTGPFALTSQNTPANTTAWVGGQPVTITWSVNGTNQAPINVSQVRISLSTDGGQTFGTVLAAAVPNSGTASITVPNVTTSQARVRVEAVGNIFFDINDADFAITPGTSGPSEQSVATLLRDCGFSGAAVTLPVGDFTLSQLQARGILNDDVSSLGVSSGFEVVLFDGDNFQGESLTVVGNEACLLERDFNDRTSSVRVRPVSTATLYEHCGFGGYAVVLPAAGTYSLTQLQALGFRNDDISSLRVSSGVEVVLYADDNLGGASLSAGADNSCLIGAGFNDRVSSVLVRNAANARASAPAPTVAELVASLRAPLSLNVYPNPVADELLLGASQSLSGTQLQVLDAQGRTLRKGPGAAGRLDVSALPAGVYTLRVLREGQPPVTTRFVK